MRLGAVGLPEKKGLLRFAGFGQCGIMLVLFNVGVYVYVCTSVTAPVCVRTPEHLQKNKDQWRTGFFEERELGGLHVKESSMRIAEFVVLLLLKHFFSF